MKDTTINRVYYAQNREDLIIDAYFPDVKRGFYVDIGAYHPDKDSVTKLFYQKGWRGINVEPQPIMYKLFTEQRERDINLNVGVSNTVGNMTLRSYENGGLSTLSSKIKKNYTQNKLARTDKFEDININVTTLEQIFKNNNVSTIQFLKVDVEGHEYEVLQGNNWDIYRPEVICIEAAFILKNWRPLLKRQGYILSFFDGLNEYYTDINTDRAKKLDFINRVLLEAEGGIKVEDYERILTLEKSNAEYAELVEIYQRHLDHITEKIKVLEASKPVSGKAMFFAYKKLKRLVRLKQD